MIEPVEIPWWVWLVIWVGLALALIAMIALFAWWLFRKFLRLLDDVGDLAGRAEILAVDDGVIGKPAIAVLADVRDIRAREDARRAHRAQRRRDRHERRMARARLITGTDATSVQWPAEWYGRRTRSTRQERAAIMGNQTSD